MICPTICSTLSSNSVIVIGMSNFRHIFISAAILLFTRSFNSDDVIAFHARADNKVASSCISSSHRTHDFVVENKLGMILSVELLANAYVIRPIFITQMLLGLYLSRKCY